jgi:hypothetical protein
VGCGRLLPDGKIGRMAVLPAERGRGTGAALLGALLDEARRAGMPEVYLHAQRQAEGFYGRQGFTQRGEPFEEAGIPHLAMARAIDYRDCPGPVIAVRYPEPAATLALALAASARRRLAILSPALDPALFDAPALAEALTALCRRSRDAQIRLLVADGRGLAARGHRLLNLARRLPSSLALRQLEEHPAWPGDSLLVRDRDGLLALPAESRDRGSYDPGDRPGAASALERFEELWRQGRELEDFRALHL